MGTRIEAISAFLKTKAHPDLAGLYNPNMEVQVNVSQDRGERVDGEYKGKATTAWSDGVTTWKAFRIPWKANTTPEFIDTPIHFDLFEHAEAIGMTGWDWTNRVSRWVAYDFDAIIGHSDRHKKKLSQEQLDAVRNAVTSIDWVTIRKSTAGKGLHLYVMLDNVPTENHNEHAALARSILGKMSALSGFDFASKVDICGGNMWVWARKMAGTDGLTIIKQGGTLYDVPPNWRDHCKVVSGKVRKNLPQNVENIADDFELLCGQSNNVPLDDSHKKLIAWLTENNAFWWWDQDHHMLVTHTVWLKEASDSIGYKGKFETASDGRNKNEQNVFCNPGRRGSWVVRRFSPGCAEHESWEQDGAGWTRCYLNRDPDLKTAARTYQALENEKGDLVFREAEQAAKAAAMIGAEVKFAPYVNSRQTIMKLGKDGRLLVKIAADPNDRADQMPGWFNEKGKFWIKHYTVNKQQSMESDSANYDDLLRHLADEGNKDAGWMIRADGSWRDEPITHIKLALQSLGQNGTEVSSVLGSAVLRAWKLVNKPFQPEYTGDREWNRDAAQFRYVPTQSDELKYPNWDKILNHVGAGIDGAVSSNVWCKSAGIKTGAEYLKCWIGCILQDPTEPLPYLFLYSANKKQNTGKSILHEALGLLLTKGYKRCERSLTNQNGFNYELQGALICVVEEVDLRSNKNAYNRMKDWVTARTISIEGKGDNAYDTLNTTHWIQCANDAAYCPVFAGDTRVTMICVPPIDPMDLIPKKRLMDLLDKEAPDFLAAMLNLDLPITNDRLSIPALDTDDKTMAQSSSKTDLERFIDDNTILMDGRKIKFADFYDKFIKTIDATEWAKWSKIRVSKEIPITIIKGRSRVDNYLYLGNIWWNNTPTEEPKCGKLVLNGEHIDVTRNT